MSELNYYGKQGGEQITISSTKKMIRITAKHFDHKSMRIVTQSVLLSLKRLLKLVGEK